jgi:hypothetical protein
MISLKAPPPVELADIESVALLEGLEEQERQSLEQLEGDHVAGDVEVEADEKTPWLLYTK